MKNVKKLLLVLVVASPIVTNFSCSGMFWREMWAAAIRGAATVVETGATDAFTGGTSLFGG